MGLPFETSIQCIIQWQARGWTPLWCDLKYCVFTSKTTIKNKFLQEGVVYLDFFCSVGQWPLLLCTHCELSYLHHSFILKFLCFLSVQDVANLSNQLIKCHPRLFPLEPRSLRDKEIDGMQSLWTVLMDVKEGARERRVQKLYLSNMFVLYLYRFDFVILTFQCYSRWLLIMETFALSLQVFELLVLLFSAFPADPIHMELAYNQSPGPVNPSIVDGMVQTSEI